MIRKWGAAAGVAASMFIQASTSHAEQGSACDVGLISRGTSPAIQFAQALDARKSALDWEGRKKAELQITHALQLAGLNTSAHRAYQALLEDMDAPTPVRQQALACSIEIEHKFPSLIHRRSVDFMAERPGLNAQRPETQEWIFRQFQAALAQDRKSAQTWASMLVPAESPYAQMAKVWLLSSDKKPKQAYEILSKLLVRTQLPDALETHLNANRILAARLAFAIGKPKEATGWLKLVDHKSNLSPSSLEEMTWALLESDAPGQAVGAALQLQRGLMNRAFAPEAPMVLAMALNEACHFPAALKAIQRFKHRWEPIYTWMSHNLPGTHALLPLTRELIKSKRKSGASGKNDMLPPILGWELIRSPRYVSHETLSLELDRTPQRFQVLKEQTQKEQLRLAHEILTSNESITKRIKELRKKDAESPLSSTLVADMKALREKWKTYKALRKAAGPIKIMSENSKRWDKILVAKMGLELEAELQHKIKRMHARIEDVLDNLNLIEIEILDGASRDLVWQNAHPEFAEAAKRDLAKVETGNNWSWGSAWTQLNSDDTSDDEEVWEDELGAHAVALNDRCEQKDRYLALRKRS